MCAHLVGSEGTVEGLEPGQFRGEFVRFDRIWSYPKPVQKPHPPVLLGGESTHTLRRVVEFCDGWLPGRITFPTYDVRVQKIREMTAEQGKKMIWTGAVPVMSIDESFDKAVGKLNVEGLIDNANHQKFWLKPEGGKFTKIEELDGSLLAGSPDDIVRGIQRYQETGADLLIFDFRLRFADFLEQIEILAREVLPKVGLKAPA